MAITPLDPTRLEPSALDDPRFRELRQQLLAHPLYSSITTLPAVARFMEFHVFAVWDFMSLLKRLQREVTCTALPWLPPKSPRLARLINEITLGEETDTDGHDGFASHFDLYLGAMRDVGAQTGPILDLIETLRAGTAHTLALRNSGLPEAVRDFVGFNLDLACDGEPHRVAAAFFYGREDLIPEMFDQLLPRLSAHASTSLDRLQYYVQRHIDLDGDSHGPLARALLTELCGGDARKLREATETAIQSLSRRRDLWDAIVHAIQSLPAQPAS
jgi:hypothetical protein